MTILLLARSSDGSIIGKCDARCYNAKHPRCRCICQGINHGKGLAQALKNTHEHPDLLTPFDDGATITKPPVQLPIFQRKAAA